MWCCSKENLPAIEEPILQVITRSRSSKTASCLTLRTENVKPAMHFLALSLRCVAATQLLGAMLEESDEVPQRLLDIILGCLLAPKKDEKPITYGCALCAPTKHMCHVQSVCVAPMAELCNQACQQYGTVHKMKSFGVQAGTGAHPQE